MTRPILKGMKQDGFTMQVEYMTPARIEHEFRVKNPICTYPVEWMNPELLFSTKPDRIYSVPLDLGGESVSYIILRNESLPRFKKHLDPIGNVKMTSLFGDLSLKTQLIRDKDYGPLSAVMTTRDSLGDQVARKQYEKNISLRVLSANQQTLEMLNADRFDYAFYKDIEAEDFTRSKLDPNAFTLLPFQTGKVKDETDANLVRISIACSNTALTIEAMPYLNAWIRLHRGSIRQTEIMEYQASIDPKANQSRSVFDTTVDRFRGSLSSGALDQWFSLQQSHFPDLALLPKRARMDLKAALPTRPKSTGPWSFFWSAPEGLTLIHQSSDLYDKNRNRSAAFSLEDLGSQLPVEDLVRRYLSPEEVSTISSKSALSKSQDLGMLQAPASATVQRLTLFGDPDQTNLKTIHSFIAASKLTHLQIFGANAETTAALVQTLPKSLKHLNLTGSALGKINLSDKMRDLKLLSLHLNHTQLNSAQFMDIIPLLRSIEHLSLGYLRTLWNDETVALFNKNSWSRLKSLDLGMSFLSDSQALPIILALPPSLEALDLSSTFLSRKGLMPLFERQLPHLASLNLNYSLLGSLKGERIRIPPSVKHLYLKSTALSSKALNHFELPPALTSLDLSRNDLTDSALDLIQKKLSARMDFLDLGQNGFTREPLIKFFKSLRGKQIKALSLKHLRLLDESIAALFEHPIPGLEDLDLADNWITEAGAKILASNAIPSLKSLNAAVNPISSEGVLRMAQSFGRHLEFLNLSGLREIPAEGLGPLLPSHLKVLNLNDNQISDEQISALAPHLPKGLKALHLARSSFASWGAKALCNAIPAELEDLDLGSTLLGESEVLALVQNLPESLRALRLGTFELSPEGARILTQGLPRNLRMLRLEGVAAHADTALSVFTKLPPELRQFRFYANPRISVNESPSIRWPKPLRELYLESISFQSEEASRNLTGEMPAGLERGTFSNLTDASLRELAKQDLKSLHTLQIMSQKMTLSALNQALVSFGSTRVIDMIGNTLLYPPGIPPLSKKALSSLKVFTLVQSSTPPAGLRRILENLPSELWHLSVAANQISASEIEGLLHRLPKNLHVLGMEGNDVGMKGLQILDRYKAKKEEDEGLPFEVER